MLNSNNIYRNIFAQLIRTKLSLFRSVAVKIVNSSADADDVVQNALLRAWNKRRDFKGDQNIMSAWVIKIIISESYNHLRKKQREKNKIRQLTLDSPQENPALSPQCML